MKKRAWVADYVIRKPDGHYETGSETYSAPDIFSATEKAKDKIEDYKNQVPEDEIRLVTVDLSAAYTIEDLFEEEDEND